MQVYAYMYMSMSLGFAVFVTLVAFIPARRCVRQVSPAARPGLRRAARQKRHLTTNPAKMINMEGKREKRKRNRKRKRKKREKRKRKRKRNRPHHR